MNKYPLWILVLVSLSIFGFHSDDRGTSFDKSSAGGENPDLSDMEPGIVVVRLASDAARKWYSEKSLPESWSRTMKQFGSTEFRPVFPSLRGKGSLKKADVLEELFYLSFDVTNSPFDVAEIVSRHASVRYAEPLYIRWTMDMPDDPQFTAQTGFQRVEADSAWDWVKGQDGDIIVAVVDGGTDWTHEDLLFNSWINPGEIAGNGLDDDNNGFVDDVRGWNFQAGTGDPNNTEVSQPSNRVHGTHVAGILGAVTDNATGISSLSWNPKVMFVNAASKTSDSGISFGFEGIAYAAANGASVINCSFGSNAFSQAEQDIVDVAYANGALVVAASGNDGSLNDIKPHYPSDLNHVLSVGNTFSASDQKNPSSNFGVSVDVYAPGSSIISTAPGNAYLSLTGTSMSSPMVAALAALVKTQNPAWSVDKIREQIRVTADPIDEVTGNTGLAGFLGKGRINARRAVTEFFHPSVRIKNISAVDLDGNQDGIVDAGETVRISLDLVNYLADATGVNASISSSDGSIAILSNNASIGNLDSEEETSVTFEFKTDTGLKDGYSLRFVLALSGAGFEDKDLFTLTVTPPGFVTHNTGRVTASMTTRGNIGYNGFQDPSTGDGFRIDGRDMLFEGSFMIGTQASRLSDAARAARGSLENDFQPVRGQVLTLSSPGAITYEQSSVVLTDEIAVNPLFVTINQESYADTSQANQNFIFVRYLIENTGTSTLSNLHAGLFFDWDVNLDAVDFARYDYVRRMGIVQDKASDPTYLAASMLMTDRFIVNYKSIDNAFINDANGYTSEEKWADMTGQIQTVNLNGKDVSTMLSAKLPDLQPGAKIQIGFAILGARSQEELIQAADAAQALWNNTLVNVTPENGLLPQAFSLLPNYPNPFNPTTTLPFTLDRPTDLSLVVFNALGQLVRTLESGIFPAGTHQVVWDGTDQSGRQVPTGVYFARMSVAGENSMSRVRKLLLIK